MVSPQFTFVPHADRRTRKEQEQEQKERGNGHGGTELRYRHWSRYNTFYGLVITTALACTLLAADIFEWRVTGYFFRVANNFPGTVALIVQLLAAFFGLIHVTVLCRLVNYALRLRLRTTSVTLDILRTWVDMTIPRVDWDLPLRFFFPVLFVVFLSLVPAALWAGSITPLIARTTTGGTLLVPSYQDVSLIKEYPIEVGKTGPSLRNQKGFFTYSVGVQHIGNLLSSAASASSGIGTESSGRVHSKFDNTQFSYVGRSYGVGGPTGLTDLLITSNNQAAGYVYQESGYLCNVTCIYNQTSDFHLSPTADEWIFEASGNLPDSLESPELSSYIGHDSAAIVAIGVAHSSVSPRRYLAITSGASYAFLNNTQCTLDFTPTLFNLTVDLANSNITVAPIHPIPDFNPQRNLTRTLVRQFELLSNDLTNLYVSLLGDALNSSVAAYNMSRASVLRDPFSEQEATLAGLTHSITAMADDMLVAYGSAQLMIASQSISAEATVFVFALQFGQRGYIYSIFVFNSLVLLLVLTEAIRTRGWRELGGFNYLDLRDLIVAASRGGNELARSADTWQGRKLRRFGLLADPDEGNGGLSVRLVEGGDGVAIVVADGDGDEEAEGVERGNGNGSPERPIRSWSDEGLKGFGTHERSVVEQVGDDGNSSIYSWGEKGKSGPWKPKRKGMFSWF